MSNPSALSFSDRIAEIKAKTSTHESRISSLLSRPAIEAQSFDLPQTPFEKSESSYGVQPSKEVPYIPIPEFNYGEVPSDAADGLDSSLSASESNEPKQEENFQEPRPELDDAYAELYESEGNIKRTGYYFGPLIGFVFPEDSALRTSSGIEPYSSESGYSLGFQVGRDFGTVRVEGEYSYIAHDGSGGISVGVNSLLSRIILDFDVTESLDLRAGLGMGFGFVGIDGGSSGEPSDVGFAYDFLLGLGYNFYGSWSLCLDYKYYLTAANDAYDRIKTHAVIFSANFEL